MWPGTTDYKTVNGRTGDGFSPDQAGRPRGTTGKLLIHGVTSSGKTEVYMQTIAEVIAAGKTAIMLVPEIALTKQITDRFIARFGKENIAVLHSKLTKRERFDEWMRIRKRSGEDCNRRPAWCLCSLRQYRRHHFRRGA